MNERLALWQAEIAATFALSWPIVLTNLATQLMTSTDVMMLGWLSPEALAGGSLGFNLYLPLYLFLVGIVGAAAPIAAARFGADRSDLAGVRSVAHQSFWLSLALAAPSVIALWNATSILRAVGEPPELAELAGGYLHGLVWSIAPGLLYFSARSIFSALGRTTPILWAALIALLVNALANYALVFGNLGAPKLGVLGWGWRRRFRRR